MSKVDAHWELIPEIKKLRDAIAPDTLLTINGDIPERQTGLKLASGRTKNKRSFSKSERSLLLLGALTLPFDDYPNFI